MGEVKGIIAVFLSVKYFVSWRNSKRQRRTGSPECFSPTHPVPGARWYSHCTVSDQFCKGSRFRWQANPFPPLNVIFRRRASGFCVVDVSPRIKKRGKNKKKTSAKTSTRKRKRRMNMRGHDGLLNKPPVLHISLFFECGVCEGHAGLSFFFSYFRASNLIPHFSDSASSDLPPPWNF